MYSPKYGSFPRLTDPRRRDLHSKYHPRSLWQWLRPRRMRRRTGAVLLAIVIMVTVLRWMRPPEYDWRFLDDESEDLVGAPMRSQSFDPQDKYAQTPDRIQSKKRSKAVPRSQEHLFRSDDGLTRVGDWRGRHPLLEIIQQAEGDFEEEAGSRPNTLIDAYHQYIKDRGKKPPASYPSFYELLPPACPFPSTASLDLYSPLSATLVRARQTGLEGSPGTVTFGVKGGRVGVGFVKNDADVESLRSASKQLVDVLVDIAPHLPDLRFALSPTHPRNPVPFRLRGDMEDLRRIGETFDEDSGDWDEDGDGDGVFGFRGWDDACPRTSVLASGRSSHENYAHRFIHTASPLSPCDHPALLNQSDFYATEPPSVGILTPLFSYARAAIHGDILLPRPDTLHHAETVKWEDKIPQLYWRGVSGDVAAEEELACPVNRLVYLTTRGAAHSAKQRILIPEGSDGFTQATRKTGEILAELTDVAYTRCEWDYGCEDMKEKYRFDTTSADGHQPGSKKWSAFKFVLDIDSHHGPSLDFRSLLLTGSLVLRSSVYEDYWTAQARPWVHYVPVQPDFSDLASILLFFRAHDESAKKIALAGQALARECFGRSGVKAGLILTLGEYGRMWNTERKGADMEAP